MYIIKAGDIWEERRITRLLLFLFYTLQKSKKTVVFNFEDVVCFLSSMPRLGDRKHTTRLTKIIYYSKS